MLILEIILTVTSWNRGFKAWALLPVGVAVSVGFLIGLSNPQIAQGDDYLSLVWLDVMAIIVLISMIAKGDKRVAESNPGEVHELSSSDSNLPEG